MPIILIDGTILDVEKYNNPYNDNQARDSYIGDNKSCFDIDTSNERDRRVKEDEVRTGTIDFPKLEDDLLDSPVVGSVGWWLGDSSGVCLDDFDIPRVGEGNVSVEIDNWRHAIIYAMSVLRKEQIGFKHHFFHKDNIYASTLHFRGFDINHANYLTETIAETDFLLDNLNTLDGFGLRLAEKESYSKATFNNLINNKSAEIKAQDEHLFDEMCKKAIKEEKIHEFLQSFKPSDRKFLKKRTYALCIDMAVESLRKLGYIRHPKSELFKFNVNDYYGLTDITKVKRSALALNEDGSYLVHEDQYKLYHILFNKKIVSTREKTLCKINISELVSIDVNNVMQYDEFIDYDYEEGTICAVYQVIEIFDDNIRLLKISSRKSIETLRKLSIYLTTTGVKTEQTLSLRDSQYITFKVQSFYN